MGPLSEGSFPGSEWVPLGLCVSVRWQGGLGCTGRPPPRRMGSTLSVSPTAWCPQRRVEGALCTSGRTGASPSPDPALPGLRQHVDPQGAWGLTWARCQRGSWRWSLIWSQRCPGNRLQSPPSIPRGGPARGGQTRYEPGLPGAVVPVPPLQLGHRPVSCLLLAVLSPGEQAPREGLLPRGRGLGGLGGAGGGEWAGPWAPGSLAGWASLPTAISGPAPTRRAPSAHGLLTGQQRVPACARVPGGLRGPVWHTLEALETVHAATVTAFPRKPQPASCRAAGLWVRGGAVPGAGRGPQAGGGVGSRAPHGDRGRP